MEGHGQWQHRDQCYQILARGPSREEAPLSKAIPRACTRVPALASDKIATVAPFHRVPPFLEVRVVGWRKTITPPRIEEAVVPPLRAGRALLQFVAGAFVGDWGGVDAAQRHGPEKGGKKSRHAEALPGVRPNT